MPGVVEPRLSSLGEESSRAGDGPLIEAAARNPALETIPG
jgi:hypothetical protein